MLIIITARRARRKYRLHFKTDWVIIWTERRDFMKIVNLDGFTTNPGDQSWDWMGNYGDYKVYDRTTADQVVERAKGANLLIINKTVLDRATLEALRPGAGIHWAAIHRLQCGRLCGSQGTGYYRVQHSRLLHQCGGAAGVCFYPILYQPGCSAYTGGRKR